MTGSDQDSGQSLALGLLIRQVEQSGDGKSGLAFEENLLDAKAIGLGRAEGLCVERRALGQTAEPLEQTASHLRLPGLSLGARGDSSDGHASRFCVFCGDLIERVD